MAARRQFSFGNLAFWVVLFGASAGAFSAGFYYTYGATVNVNTKLPGADAITAKPRPSVKPVQASPSPTAPPGLVALPSAAAASPSPRVAPTRTPDREIEAAFAPEPVMATPTPAPRRLQPVPSPQSEIYRVHVGGFADRETAQRQVEELQGAGINAVVVYDQGKYHAQLGAFTDRARALSVADEVNIRGYSVTIRR